MWKHFRNLALGCCVSLLCCELVLRCLPVSTSTAFGYFVDPVILSYPAHHVFMASTGWDLRNAQVNQANNFGFVASHDFRPGDDAIGLIGDSYVESSMLPMNDRPAAQIERVLGGRLLYAMGAPGSALLDYVERVRWASQRFGTRDFILVLEEGDLWESICGSGQSHGPCLDKQSLSPRIEKLPPPGLAKRILRHLALAQYISGQLKLDPSRLIAQARLQARPPEPAEVERPAAVAEHRVSPGAREVAAKFLERLSALRPHRVLIVLDAHREAIYAGLGPRTGADLELFADMASTAGYDVLRTADALSADYAARHLSFDVGPYDHHLNALGWRIIARAIADTWKPAAVATPALAADAVQPPRQARAAP
ncbi:MAG: hypothetical protein JO006_04895 [Paucibacter sp.]|nr:hypothetical protein [Roseateles sp.]